MELLSSFSAVPFYLIAGIAVVCSLGMIFNPNLVRAGFTLIGSFCAIAGLYFLLDANFVAVSQILIYAVGIVLVIVFAVMLCNLDEVVSQMSADEAADRKAFPGKLLSGALISIALFVLLVYLINTQDWSAIISLQKAKIAAQPVLEGTDASKIGLGMLSYYVLPFELISVLLLIVLVGVVILSKKEVN